MTQTPQIEIKWDLITKIEHKIGENLSYKKCFADFPYP